MSSQWGRRVGLFAVVIPTIFTACGSDDSGGSARDVRVETVEYAFRSDDEIVIEAGDTIRFIVSNIGAINHELEVLTDASRRLGKTDEIPPGEERSVTVTFEEPGTYLLICDIDDHRSRGQQAQFTVEPGA